MREKTAPAIGITSDLGSGMHSVQLDYDKLTIGAIKAKIRRMIAKFALGEAHIYKTNHGYHVKFYGDEVRWGKYKKLLIFSNGCKNFIIRSIDDKFSTLRISGKYEKNDIELACVVPGFMVDSKKEKARHRKRFEERLMGLSIPKEKAFKNG